MIRAIVQHVAAPALVMLASIAAPAAVAQAPLNAAPVVAPAVADHVLRAGTSVPLQTLDSLDTRRNHQGDRFALVVTEDVRVGPWTVIPKGSRATGEIARLAPRSSLGQSGRMELMLLHVDVAAARIRLTGRAGAAGAGSTADRIATTAFAYAFAPFVMGKSAVLPAGSPMIGYVQRDLPIEPAQLDGIPAQ